MWSRKSSATRTQNTNRIWARLSIIFIFTYIQFDLLTCFSLKNLAKLVSFSWHQTTKAKPRILFSHLFPPIFLSLRSWKRKQTFRWSKTEKKPPGFGPIKSFFFFNCSRENKIRGLVVGCHEQDIGCNNKHVTFFHEIFNQSERILFVRLLLYFSLKENLIAFM